MKSLKNELANIGLMHLIVCGLVCMAFAVAALSNLVEPGTLGGAHMTSQGSGYYLQ